MITTNSDGQALSEAFAQAVSQGIVGYDLALVARDGAALAEVIASLPEACGNAVAIPADLALEDAYESVVGECVAQLGGLDVLVNCAGLSQAGPFEEVSPEQWDRIFAVNAKAPFFISRALCCVFKQFTLFPHRNKYKIM